MTWLNKPTQTLTIIATFVVGCIWMNSRFNAIEKDMTVMKTLAFMKYTTSKESANNGDRK